MILAARRRDKLEALGAELKNALPLEMDVASRSSVQQAFETLEQQNERVDICINNAGIAPATPIFGGEGDDDSFDALLQTNVMGVWYVTRAVANHMKTHNLEGSIINISSINGINRLRARATGYSASKAAVVQMTKALVGELSPAKIRVNCIVPGVFHTPLTAYRFTTPEGRKLEETKIPLGFVADPRDLDGAILYLASNKLSRYVTGTCLTADGGISWGG